MMHKSVETKPDQQKRSVLLPLVFWILFFAGLGLQFFSPHMAIDHNSFVLPDNASRPGEVLDPRALVQRQRAIQAASAGLVLLGAFGLGIWYRDLLARSWSGK